MFFPEEMQRPSSNFPQVYKDSENRFVAAYDTTTEETAYWTRTAQVGLTTPLTATVFFRAASATTGTFQPKLAIEAITPGDAVNTASTASWDSGNTPTATAVPGTAGYMDDVDVTLTNNDSITAGDLYRLSLARNVSGDNAPGDIEVLAVQLKDDGG